MDKISEIKKDLKIRTILLYIVIAISLILNFKIISLSLDYAALEEENKNLKGLTEMQSSAIMDLEECLRRNEDV